MKRILLLPFVSLLLLSCQDETQKSEVVTRFTTNSTLFSLEGEYFTATLKQDNSYSKGKADGSSLWQRTGPLPYILSELYGRPVEMENSSNLQNHYNLNVDWEEQSSFEEIRDEIADKTKETIGYEVNSKTRMQPNYVLSVRNLSRLQKDKDIDFVNDGAISKVSIDNEDWKIYSTLNHLADLLSEKTNRKVLTEKGVDSTAYYFELTASGGFENLITQLEENYGLAFQNNMISEEYYTINFK